MGERRVRVGDAAVSSFHQPDPDRSEFLSRLYAAAHSFPIEAFDADDHTEAALIFGDMPEMQAIKAYVNWAIHDTTDREYEPELPDSVIEWLVQ